MKQKKLDKLEKSEFLELEKTILAKINAKSEYTFKSINDSDPMGPYMRNSPLQTALYLVYTDSMESLEEKEYIFAAKNLSPKHLSYSTTTFDRIELVLQSFNSLNQAVEFKNITVEFLEILNEKQNDRKIWAQFLYMTVMHSENLSPPLWLWLAKNYLKDFSPGYIEPLEAKDLIQKFIDKKREIFVKSGIAGENTDRINRNIKNNIDTIYTLLEKEELDVQLPPEFSKALNNINKPNSKI